MKRKRQNQSPRIKLLPPLFSSQLEEEGLQEIQEQNWGRGNVLLRKCLASLEQRKAEPEKALTTSPTPQRSTVAPSDKRPTPAHLKVPPAPPQPKRVPVLVDPPAARVKKKGALIHSAHVIIGQVLGNNGATTVRNPGGPAAVPQDGEKDGAAVAGTIVAKPPVVTPTPAALSAPQPAAAPTATAAAATQTATVTTAQRAADGGTPSVRQTPTMSGGEAEDVDAPGDISIPLPPQKTPAHVHAATAAGRGTGGTIGAAQEAPAVGAAAPARDPGGAATAAAPPAAPPAPPKAPPAGEPPGVGWTVTRTAETSTAPASTAPSLHVRLHHEALTATPIHPARRL